MSPSSRCVTWAKRLAAAIVLLITAALAAGVTLGLFAPIVGLYAVVWAVDGIEDRRREGVSASRA